MNEISENTRKRLEALRRTYAEQLPGRAVAIDEAWKGLRRDCWSTEVLAGLSRQAHGLAGSGATYGFADVSAKARQLELLLDEIIETGVVSGNGRAEDVERLLQELKQVCLAAAHRTEGYG